MNTLYDNLNDAVEASYKLASDKAIYGVENNIGGPFGAAIIQKVDNKYKIISIECNTVIRDKNPIHHAEMNAIDSACKTLNKIFLDDCILVTTAKSCPMCLSASIWARIKTIYYSEDYSSASSAGFLDNSISEYIQNKNNIIEEIYLPNDETKKPFDKWNNKEDKIEY